MYINTSFVYLCLAHAYKYKTHSCRTCRWTHKLLDCCQLRCYSYCLGHVDDDNMLECCQLPMLFILLYCKHTLSGVAPSVCPKWEAINLIVKMVETKCLWPPEMPQSNWCHSQYFARGMQTWWGTYAGASNNLTGLRQLSSEWAWNH